VIDCARDIGILAPYLFRGMPCTSLTIDYCTDNVSQTTCEIAAPGYNRGDPENPPVLLVDHVFSCMGIFAQDDNGKGGPRRRLDEHDSVPIGAESDPHFWYIINDRGNVWENNSGHESFISYWNDYHSTTFETCDRIYHSFSEQDFPNGPHEVFTMDVY